MKNRKPAMEINFDGIQYKINEKDRILYKNNHYDFEVFNNGEKHFKVIKETRPNSPTGTNPVASQISPTSTIPTQFPEFNYSHGLYDKNIQEGIEKTTLKGGIN